MAVVAMLLSSACTTSTPGDESSNALTQADARRRIEAHFTDLLRDLPSSASLSRQNPKFPKAKFGGGNIVPCNDNAEGGTGPVNLGVDYWLIGIPESETRDYLGRIMNIWQVHEFKVNQDSDGDATYGRGLAPDKYALEVADNNQGFLKIAASSPCFPRAGVDDQPMPADISHPTR